MSLLILVHVEDTFRKHFPKGYVERAKQACHDYNVWHATSYVLDEQPIEEIAPFVCRQFQWGWGYEPEIYKKDSEELKFVIPSNGHEYTWIPPELRNLYQKQVFLAGGCDGECLEDMRAVLRHLNIEFNELRNLVY